MHVVCGLHGSLLLAASRDDAKWYQRQVDLRVAVLADEWKGRIEGLSISTLV